MTTLGILIASARPNRVGSATSRWVHETLAAQFPERMDIDLIDLRDVALPDYDETTSPKQGKPKEIGRASCRAREWREGNAASMKKKEEVEDGRRSDKRR